VIFEDAHWTDPTSLELVGRILERIVELRVLLIVTFRPEFNPPWISLPHVTALTINRLGRRDINAVIDRIVGNKFLPSGVREDMIERTDGIPLFIEEMTKAILEAESEEEALRTAAAIPSPRLEIPATLYASLMARLDRLGTAKELAQIGSAIGREFSHPLIAAVAGKSPAELEAALHRLISAGLLFRQGVPPHASYVFKHALVQDAAYSTLLREHRRALHGKIVDALEIPVCRHSRASAGTFGAPLYGSQFDREGGRALGKGRTTLAGARRIAGSGRTAQSRTVSNCFLTLNASSSARRNQAAGRADNPAHAL
jgi:predicted ATPase